MTQAAAIRFTPEPLRSLAFGSIVAGYTAIGTALANPVRILLLQNFTDKTLTFLLMVLMTMLYYRWVAIS